MDRYNRQRAERTKNDSVIEVFDKTGARLLWSGRLMDYSATGACFITGKELALGDQVDARIRIFGKGCVEVSGRVVRTGKRDNLNLYAIHYDSVKNSHPTGEKKNYDEYI